mgnify:CR=1 FL=1
MRKNVKQQLALRVLSTAALMAMVSSIATAAFADTYDLNKGSVDILAEGGEQRITQWADKDKDLCVKDDNGEDIRNIKDPDIVLTTKDETTGETKTGKGRRTITLPPSTAQLLRERRKGSCSQWIFPNPLRPEDPVNPGRAYSRLKTLLKSAGLPGIRFHDLRHPYVKLTTKNFACA